MSKIRNRSSRWLGVLVAGLLGLGAFGLSAPAGADIDDLTTCVDVDDQGQPQCETPDDDDGTIDDFTSETPDPEPPLPPTPVDDPVVADANFTG
jgi:hypothetical protein